MIQNYLQRNDFQKINPRAVFFDMDGVLFDSMVNHSIAWVKAMNECGLAFTREEAYMHEGQPGTDTVNFAYQRTHERQSTEEERKQIYAIKGRYFEELGEPKRIPFALELAMKLKSQGYILFIVTGSGQPSLLDNIQHYFPGLFEKENIISAFDVKRGKPFPDPYLKALERAAVEPWEAVVIENAPLGVQASSAAQIFTIAVNTGPLDRNVLSENGADIVFDSMKELFEQWDNLIVQLKV